jgi:hypothetical protein
VEAEMPQPDVMVDGSHKDHISRHRSKGWIDSGKITVTLLTMIGMGRSRSILKKLKKRGIEKN